MRHVGIDFGARGALASITDTGVICQLTKMPLLDDGTVDGYGVMVWIAEEIASCLENNEEFTITGEKLHSIFGASAKSNFGFALNIGKVKGAVECLEVPLNEVRAIDWQKHIFTALEVPEMGEVKPNGKFKRDTKGMAHFAASLLWPEQELKHDGKIDALLIAEHIRRTHLGSKVVQ